MQQSFKKALSKVQSLYRREEEELKIQLGNKLQFIKCEGRTIKSMFNKKRHSSYEDYNVDFSWGSDFGSDSALKEARNKMKMIPFDLMLMYGFPDSLDSANKFQSTIHISLTPKVATHLNNN